jgi:hypothetical protein
VSITRIAGLSPDAQAVEARIIEQVSKELDALVGQYRQRFGVVVGTDLARELFGEYTASLQSRLDFALAVQRSASHVADEVFGRILSAPVFGDALFTAGGTGAGKTTAIRTSSQTRSLISEAAIVYDSNFNSLASARAKVTMALEAGLRAIVILTIRPKNALRGFSKRTSSAQIVASVSVWTGNSHGNYLRRREKAVEYPNSPDCSKEGCTHMPSERLRLLQSCSLRVTLPTDLSRKTTGKVRVSRNSPRTEKPGKSCVRIVR